MTGFRHRRRRCAARHRDKGTAAIEFAMTMPLLLLLFLGCFDAARMLTGVEEARRAAIAVADAASSNGALSNALFTTMMQDMMANGPAHVWSETTDTGLIVTVFTTDSNGHVSLTTQAKYPSTLAQASAFGCSAGSTPAIANGISWEAGDMFIVGEVYYKFQPFVFASRLLPNRSLMTYHDYIAYRPRQPTTVSSPAGTC